LSNFDFATFQSWYGIMDNEIIIESHKNMRNRVIFQIFLTILISVLVVSTVARAGTITPPSGTASAKFYTLTEIYKFITNNTTATEGGHSFTFSDSLTGTHHTLTEIYSALSTLISASKVKLGTTYLGVAGTLTPDGGIAGVADLFNGKTAHLTNDWNLDTGTLNLACNTATFNATANKVADTYDGSGDGTNRWCMTSSGNAVEGNILSSIKAWVDGVEITGSMTNVDQQTITPTTSNQTITQGYHSGTGYCAGDAALITTNIRSGVNIFGVAGDSNVVNTSSGTAVAGDICNSTKAWVDGSEITGNRTSCSTAIDYSPQRYMTYDDYNCANNNGETNNPCGVGDAESTAEEVTWTLTNTDDSPPADLTSGKVYQDSRTGLYWSGYFSTATSNSFTIDCTDASINAGTCDPGSYATKGDAITLCDNLSLDADGGGDETDWRLPSQKELLQAYIDGEANNLSNPDGSFWSTTESYNNTINARYVYLLTGTASSGAKTTAYYVRCVRP